MALGPRCELAWILSDTRAAGARGALQVSLRSSMRRVHFPKGRYSSPNLCASITSLTEMRLTVAGKGMLTVGMKLQCLSE